MRWRDRINADLVCLRVYYRALTEMRSNTRNPARVFPALIDGLAEHHSDRLALVSEHESLTYNGLAERVNRYARWALAQDLGKGETVCLLMPNRPEYLAIWLGITRVGGVAALINTHLVGESLAACIDSVAPKHIIVAAELSLQLAGAQPLMKTNPQIWIKGQAAAGLARIDDDVEKLAGTRLGLYEHRDVTLDDHALYIFTSGVTGLPKPAIVDHRRLMLAIYGFAGILDPERNDRMYGCLPMYHMLGGIAAIGPMLVRGGSVAIREKFSASDFWRDVIRTDCTMLQYVGEIPWALLRTPEHPHETRHRLRLCLGAGLRSDIWEAFKTRFQIPRILEFYASTEGNVMLFNFEEKEGSVGRLPLLARQLFPTALIRIDVEKEAPVRDSRGYCMRCIPGEAGEAIGQIGRDWLRPISRFSGYANEADTEHRILRNVFRRGDAWFRTGDLLSQDADGYFYFVDRIGETYRWKGENVSTTEVELALRAFPGIKDAVIYGVHVPGYPGRTGMAALIAPPMMDLSALHAHLAKRLPAFARPAFVRILAAAAKAAPLKTRKAELAAEAFDPGKCKEPVYFSDAQRKAFVPLDAQLHALIMAGEASL